jgi:four helix bundle protein
VEEAQAAESAADFVSKLALGLKEARETHYRLRVVAAAEVHSGGDIQRLITEADELKRILGKIIINTKRNRASSPEMRPWTR